MQCEPSYDQQRGRMEAIGAKGGVAAAAPTREVDYGGDDHAPRERIRSLRAMATFCFVVIVEVV